MLFTNPLHQFALFFITVEAVLLLLQVVLVLAKPDNKNSRWHLLLLGLLITYNLNMLCRDPPSNVQGLLESTLYNGSLFGLSLWMIRYYYQLYRIARLGSFIVYGYWIMITALLGSLMVWFLITKDIVNSFHFLIGGPSLYVIVYVTIAIRELIFKYLVNSYRESSRSHRLTTIVPAIITLICWAAWPLMLWFDNTFFDVLFINIGFLILTLSGISDDILESKQNHKLLLRLTDSVKHYTNETQIMVTEIGQHLRKLHAQNGDDKENLEAMFIHLNHLVAGLRELHIKADLPNANQMVNISMQIKKRLQRLAPVAHQKKVLMIDDIPMGILLEGYSSHLDRILDVQLKNSIRHAERHATIQFSLKEEKGTLYLLISENGITISVLLAGAKIIEEPAVTPVPLEESDLLSKNPRRPTILLLDNMNSDLSALASELETRFTIYEVSTPSQALETLQRLSHVDLVICDASGEILREELNRMNLFKETPFLIFSNNKPSTKKTANKNTVVYLTRPVHLNPLIEMVEELTGNITTETETLRDVFDTLRKPPPPTPEEALQQPFRNEFEYNCWRCQLTPREIEIVILLNQGSTHQAIADVLFISLKTVNSHVGNIFRKARKTFKQPQLKGVVQLLNILMIRSSMEG